MMVRARRVESESSELLALTAVMTSISAVHRKDARALSGFERGKSAAAGRHDLLAIVKMPAAFGPTRPRSRLQRVVVGLFVHMLARYCQRGSRRRQTGAIVCRLRMIPAGLSASIIVRLKMAVP